MKKFAAIALLITMSIIGFSTLSASGKTISTEAKKNVGDLLDTVIPHIVDNKGEKKDYKELKDKPYVMYYFSAKWCPPCRRFTPKLVDFYNENGGKENFEIVFVSADRSVDAMKEYMKEKKMPWVAIEHSAKRKTSIRKFSPRGIPHLLLTDKKGDIIGRGQYNVLKQLKDLLPKSKTKVKKAKS
jgi:nucleoredoxin